MFFLDEWFGIIIPNALSPTFFRVKDSFGWENLLLTLACSMIRPCRKYLIVGIIHCYDSGMSSLLTETAMHGGLGEPVFDSLSN